MTAAVDARVAGTSASADIERALAREARLFTRYLVSRDCPDELTQRYVSGYLAWQRREHGAGSDDGIADFALRHPVTLPFLDAAAAVIGRGALLRSKLRLMTAVLETTPRFVAEFTPRPSSRAAALLKLTRYSLVSAAKALVGIPLLLLVARWRTS